MIKKQLVAALEKWDDDTVIEISISADADMVSPHYDSNKTWYELANVERFQPDTDHCLLIAGRVTMI